MKKIIITAVFIFSFSACFSTVYAAGLAKPKNVREEMTEYEVKSVSVDEPVDAVSKLFDGIGDDIEILLPDFPNTDFETFKDAFETIVANQELLTIQVNENANKSLVILEKIESNILVSIASVAGVGGFIIAGIIFIIFSYFWR